jgi:four helix bundle protein
MQNAEPEKERAGNRQRDIAARTYSFALRVIAVVRAMPREVVATTIARQLIRSGTSIGANVEEAEAGHSKADFISKINVARREARETLYWLRPVGDSNLVPKTRLEGLTAEADELVRILTAIVRNARRKR